MGVWGKLRTLFTARRCDLLDLDKVQATIGYHFRDESLLRLALTHRSYSHTVLSDEASNERLEFLGDSVLGLVVAHELYRDHPDIMEGKLTQAKALLVNESTLASIGKRIGLNRYLLLSPEEDRSGGRDRPSIISDAFESVIGAVYLDGGLDAARDIVLRLIYSRREALARDASRRNFKGDLLEYAQALGAGMPRYDVISEDGPDHEKVFRVVVHIDGDKVGYGSGSSKKEAEQKAAAAALESIREHRTP